MWQQPSMMRSTLFVLALSAALSIMKSAATMPFIPSFPTDGQINADTPSEPDESGCYTGYTFKQAINLTRLECVWFFMAPSCTGIGEPGKVVVEKQTTRDVVHNVVLMTKLAENHEEYISYKEVCASALVLCSFLVFPSRCNN